MSNSKRVAAILGPTIVAIVASEFPLVQPHLYDAQIPPVVYLSGTLMFVGGLVVVRVHNRWKRDWTVLVTLSGWFFLLLGLFRMFAAGASQRGSASTIPQISEVNGLVSSWVGKGSFHGGANEVFENKWKMLSEPAVLVLAALVDEGGMSVLKASLKRTLVERYGVSMIEDDQIVRRGVQQLTNADLVKTQLTDYGLP